MHKSRIYIDISVIGGYYDEEFETVAFFRAIKVKLAEQLKGMTLVQQKDFLKKVREGKIKIA